MCAARGGTLDGPRSAEETATLYRTAHCGQDAYLLTALTDAETESVWLWPDGSPAVWDDWIKGEPNNANSDEDCMVVTMTAKRTWLKMGKRWDDLPCSRRTRPTATLEVAAVCAFAVPPA